MTQVADAGGATATAQPADQQELPSPQAETAAAGAVGQGTSAPAAAATAAEEFGGKEGAVADAAEQEAIVKEGRNETIAAAAAAAAGASEVEAGQQGSEPPLKRPRVEGHENGSAASVAGATVDGIPSSMAVDEPLQAAATTHPGAAVDQGGNKGLGEVSENAAMHVEVPLRREEKKVSQDCGFEDWVDRGGAAQTGWVSYVPERIASQCMS
jgi:hypothetical protein